MAGMRWLKVNVNRSCLAKPGKKCVTFLIVNILMELILIFWFSAKGIWAFREIDTWVNTAGQRTSIKLYWWMLLWWRHLRSLGLRGGRERIERSERSLFKDVPFISGAQTDKQAESQDSSSLSWVSSLSTDLSISFCWSVFPLWSILYLFCFHLSLSHPNKFSLLTHTKSKLHQLGLTQSISVPLPAYPIPQQHCTLVSCTTFVLLDC